MSVLLIFIGNTKISKDFIKLFTEINKLFFLRDFGLIYSKFHDIMKFFQKIFKKISKIHDVMNYNTLFCHFSVTFIPTK